ncbi:MAG: hypothetical protein SFW66_03525 [Gammaproteobacteria bacterium]|nr:hypothetical protein [Gammaproteobacteria bacterium]
MSSTRTMLQTFILECNSNLYYAKKESAGIQDPAIEYKLDCAAAELNLKKELEKNYSGLTRATCLIELLEKEIENGLDEVYAFNRQNMPDSLSPKTRTFLPGIS